jgi:predicted house-cleaning noncanonical NTP pyrophosphatase (MazG superfamily)
MKAEKLKKELLEDFSDILTAKKLKYLEDCLDSIINIVKHECFNDLINNRVEIDTHGANDIINK